jgi:L-2-hydroxyglutarate oxidase
LGTCLAFWISELFDFPIALIDMENRVAAHTSSRNTGVVHRPFYLNPDRKKKFAMAANNSFGMWQRLAKEYSLPWRQTGVIEVSIHEDSLRILEEYLKWADLNGMGEDEVELLTPSEVRTIEPLVDCKGGLISRADTSVDYGRFTECILSLAQSNGVSFIGGRKVEKVNLADDGTTALSLKSAGSQGAVQVRCKTLINAAGGGALRLAHSMGIAKEFAELHFRGDYWKVTDPGISSRISHSIYSIPRHSEYPFLDPHLILRANGSVEIGPNAAMVAGPYVYNGFSGGMSQLASELIERPIAAKMGLFFDSEFLSLIWSEWRRSVSKKAMCDRVREFVPTLNHEMLGGRGVGGVRNSLVSGDGFVSEAVEKWSDHSLHVLNYNSPGATGAPAFSAQLVLSLIERGYLDNGGRRHGAPHRSLWSFSDVASVD